MRAGGMPPATPPSAASTTSSPWSFNESRGHAPGDTCVVVGLWRRAAVRSMRAGGMPPATPGPTGPLRGHRRSFNESRGHAPGDTTLGGVNYLVPLIVQ